MTSMGLLRDRDELARRLVVTAVLLLAYRAGTQIPLPGLDQQALAQIGGRATEALSIFALGIGPLVTVLILAEFLKVIAPRLRAWEQAEPHHRDRLTRIVVALALVAAAAQALGLAVAMEDVAGLVAAPGALFRLVCVVTLVGGAAIVIWLADGITRHGIGSGVWLLLVTPALADVPHRMAAFLAWPGFAALGALLLAFDCGILILILAAIIALLRAGGGSLQTSATCLWSVLLANAAWPWLMLAVAALLSGGSTDGLRWLTPQHPLALLVLAGLVAAFVPLYARSQRTPGTGAVLPLAPAVLAGGLAAIILVDTGLTMHLPVLPIGPSLILIAVVALTILTRWWQPPFDVRAQDGPHVNIG